MSSKDETDKVPDPFYHESENFVSAYFGKIPDAVLKQAGGKTDMKLVSSLVGQLTDPNQKENRITVLNMLRDAQAQELLVAIIRMKEYAPKRAELIAAAWESGLDFSDYLDVFVRIAVDGDYGVCLEATTLITENMSIAPDPVQLENAMALLNNRKEQIETNPLLTSVIDHLVNLSGQ